MTSVSWQHTLLLDKEALKNFDPYHFLCELASIHPELFLKRSELSTILSELYSNALEHGLLSLPSSLKTSVQGMLTYYEERQQKLEAMSSGQITIHLDYKGNDASSRGSGVLVILVEDSGTGFNHKKQSSLSERVITHPQKRQYSGRGMALVRALCHHVEYLDRGNKVKAIYFIEN